MIKKYFNIIIMINNIKINNSYFIVFLIIIIISTLYINTEKKNIENNDGYNAINRDIFDKEREILNNIVSKFIGKIYKFILNKTKSVRLNTSRILPLSRHYQESKNPETSYYKVVQILKDNKRKYLDNIINEILLAKNLKESKYFEHRNDLETLVDYHVNRKNYDCFGQLPDVKDPNGYSDFIKKCRVLGKDIWEITGKKDVDIVFEHPGESTFPVSCYLVKTGGMVVICAGTSGYNLTMDARYVWMRQKRIQGSHFANLFQAKQANDMMINKLIKPLMSECFKWSEIPVAHTKMMNNKHLPGNMAALVQAKKTGMKSFNEL